MSERFYVSQPIAGERVTLDGPEAHHLLRVMRAAVGERVTLFDGGGCEFVGEIVRCGRNDAELAIVERCTVDRELPLELVVGVSLPKGDRQKWLVEKLTELGARRLVPLVTARGVAQPTAGAFARLARGVIEATKQCGRNRLMAIAKPQAWGDWLLQASTDAVTVRRFLAHPGGLPLGEINLHERQPTHLAIGPEGGFTPDEAAAAVAAGWQAVDLGPRILRVETAAVALAAVVALTARP